MISFHIKESNTECKRDVGQICNRLLYSCSSLANIHVYVMDIGLKDILQSKIPLTIFHYVGSLKTFSYNIIIL